MKKYGLIGFPLEQSFSKAYFTEKFRLGGIDAQYENYAIEDINLVHSIVEQNPELQGLNITIPYKEKIIPLLDRLDETAEKVGAVNVVKIIRHENRKPELVGFNSDSIGFERTLPKLPGKKHHRALVLGTGGASKAIQRALSKMGIEYKTVSRNAAAADLTYQQLNESLVSAHTLIVNCTPLGMFPKVDQYPPIPYQFVGKDHCMYDLIYNPEVTRFMEMGIERGAQAKNGYEMLIKQAREAWQFWNQ